MPTYSKANAAVHETVNRIVEKYHGKLRDAGVTIDCLFAHPQLNKNGDPTGSALKHHGYPAQAVVRVTNLKERTKGHADAEVVIDADNWDILGEEERDALIDHELTHLELVYKKGVLQRDDLDRPKLRLRKHDRQFGWFDEIARRHGEASPEAKQAQDFFRNRDVAQLYLPGFDSGLA